MGLVSKAFDKAIDRLPTWAKVTLAALAVPLSVYYSVYYIAHYGLGSFLRGFLKPLP